jgi:hypothetical protein
MRLLFRRRGDLEMRLPDSTPGNRALRQALIRMTTKQELSSVAISASRWSLSYVGCSPTHFFPPLIAWP